MLEQLLGGGQCEEQVVVGALVLAVLGYVLALFANTHVALVVVVRQHDFGVARGVFPMVKYDGPLLSK